MSSKKIMRKTLFFPDVQKCLYSSQFKQQSPTESPRAVTCSHDILSYNKESETKIRSMAIDVRNSVPRPG